MQVVSYTALFDVSLPGNTGPVYSYIRSMSSFDIFNPTDYIIVNVSHTDPFNDGFEGLGFGSCNFYNALGSISVIACMLAFMHLIAPLLKKCKRKSRSYFMKGSYITQVLFTNITDMPIFKQTRFDVANEWIRFLLETYLELNVAAILSLYSISWISEETIWDRFD